MISFLAPAAVRSNGVIACRITLTAMFTRQALVYVYKRKEKTVDFIQAEKDLKIFIFLCSYLDMGPRLIFA